MRSLNRTVLLLAAALLSSAVAADEIPIEVIRVSDRVLVLNATAMENNVIAIAAENGLVVVDSTGLPSVARRIRSVIEKEFGRSDFKYLINTHFHWDHAWGNMAFADLRTVAHEGVTRRLREDTADMNRTIENFKLNRQRSRESLAGLDPDSDQAKRARAVFADAEAAIRDYGEGFQAVPPVISFNDRMTLDLGDLTLELVYFGRSHSGTDVFIHIPEEGLLLTGDIFLDGRWTPLFSAGGTLDIDRWIEVLDGLLADDNIRRIIPGHQHFWPRERLELWRDYIVDLWRGVTAAKREGLSLEDALVKFPLGEEYLYLKHLGHDDDELRRFQERNVRAFWRQDLEPADERLYQTLTERGHEAFLAEIEAVKNDHGHTYDIQEASLNALGYRLMQEGKHREAVVVFELNVTLFPQSWNVHDSLGEALMGGDRIEEALRHYRKSVELGSGNQRIEGILDELEGTLFDIQRETKAAPRFPPGENTGLQGPYLGQEPPGLEPRIFAPGIVSTAGSFEFSCTFSPDGREFYFTRRKSGEGNRMLLTRRTGDGWTMPETASFSGVYGGHEPHIRPDGTRLYFGSRRPINEGETATYGIWEAERSGGGWSEPRYFGPGMFVTLARSGTLYLTNLADPPGIGLRRPTADGYGPIEMLGSPVNSLDHVAHPCIAPDESFLIFDGRGPDSRGGEADLYVSFRESDGSWGAPLNLGDAVNSRGTELCAAISPDGKYLFYLAKRDIYWVSADILDSVRPKR